jgi:GT2 family glycosyltransferase
VKIAVLTMTRDRLDYTQACFASLHEYAGCDFDHYVLDQGSDDGTQDWLQGELQDDRIFILLEEPENIGRTRALTRLVALTAENDDYDVIITFDNDCELTQPNTIRDLANLVDEGGCILSPRVLGLRNTPQSTRELVIGDEPILDVPQIGGICMAIPAWVFDEFRYDESQLMYDDIHICGWFRQQGGTCGYVKRLECWHYETTDGQHARYPEYFERRVLEGGPA